jgi:hypothetical protein
MIYAEVLGEIQTLAQLDGIRDENGRLTRPFKFNPMVRMAIVKRLRRLKKAQETFDETRLKLAEQRGIKDKRPEEMEPQVLHEFQLEIQTLLDSDAGVESKFWTEKELNLEEKENDIPVTVIDLLLEKEATTQG